MVPNVEIIKEEQRSYTIKVWVDTTGEKGKVNKAVLKILADHFKLKSSEISILKHEKIRIKIIPVDYEN